MNGSPEALTDGDGVVKWRQQWPARLWGRERHEVLKDAHGVMQNLRFQGQYLDRETGLHYNLFRYYDPECGRFTQPDPINLAGGMNLYQYAPNPLGWINPWGLCKVHGNSKKSEKAQHGYEIRDTRTGKVVKTGISGGRIRKDGKSSRAEKQVRDGNNEPGNEGRYESDVVHHEPAGPGAREKALDWEKQNADKHRPTLDPERHKTP
ncbi:hypothetical protein IFE76_002526 [Salmonella enterica]|nr:hypothetical protein [Salmonella enterica]EGM2015750.1 hypothetical protein [Salmonella enterica]